MIIRKTGISVATAAVAIATLTSCTGGSHADRAAACVKALEGKLRAFQRTIASTGTVTKDDATAFSETPATCRGLPVEKLRDVAMRHLVERFAASMPVDPVPAADVPPVLRAGTGKPATCGPLLAAVSDIARQGRLNLRAGTMARIPSIGQRQVWSGEISKAYTPPARMPTAADNQVRDAEELAMTLADGITDSKTAAKFVASLQHVVVACT